MRTLTPLVCAGALLLAACSDDDKPGTGDGGADAALADGGVQVTPVSDQELLDACIRASACGVKTFPTLANCVEAYHTLYVPQGIRKIYDHIFHCVNEARGDCEEVSKCFQRGGACDSSFKARCEGTRAISCDTIDKRIYTVDCAVAGLECGVRSGSSTTASCTPGSCYSSFQPACKGDIKQSCIGGVIEQWDCAEEGLTCGPVGNKEDCIGEITSSCGKGWFDYCKGSVAYTCVNYTQHRTDCAKSRIYNTKCDQGSCVAAGTACDKDNNRCNGDKLEACLDGKWRSFDCSKLGLGPCWPGSVGANCSKP